MNHDIIGGSLERLRRLLPGLSRESGPIVLTGEQGTGKSLVAAHIHALRDPAGCPLAWMNIALLSERDRRLGLFGAEPPELTTTKRAILELSTTVLLKHIDHAEPYLQEKLAGALHDGAFTRLGSSKVHRVAARLIFTLRQPVSVLERSGRLNPDLARHLRTCRRIHIPPLRERLHDIPDLAGYFLKSFRTCGDSAVDDRVKHAAPRNGSLAQLRYPDNLRDLMTLLRTVTLDPLEETAHNTAAFEAAKMMTMIDRGSEFSLPAVLHNIELAVLERAAEVHAGRSAEIARRLGLTERDVRRKLGQSGR